MSTGGWEEGGTTASTSTADVWEEWVVLALLVLVGVALVALGCWLWRNCTAARRDAAEGEATSGVHIKQRQVSVEEQSALLEAGAAPGPCVLDVGGAMLCQDPPLPDHPYENVMTAESLGVPQYENVRNVPPWLQMVFSRARRGLPVPRPPPRPPWSGIAAQASNLHPQGGNLSGLHQQQPALVLTRGHQPHVGSPAQLQPGLSTAGMEVFHTEPVATSTPQSSSGSSPESGGLDRTGRVSRGSRPPVGQSLETCHMPGRDSSSSQQTRHDREHGASVLALRGGHRHFKPSWTRRGSNASTEEPVYEGVQAVPMGLATPIRRQSPPHGGQPEAARWEGHPPVSKAPPPGGLHGAKPPGAPEDDSRGARKLQRHPLQFRGQSAAAEPQSLAHQRSLTSSSSATSAGRRKPPRPLPRTSLEKSRGEARSVQLEVDVHAEPRSYSLTNSPEALPSARSIELRK